MSPRSTRDFRRLAGFAALALLLHAAPAWAEGRYESLPLLPKDAVLIEKSAEMEELLRRRGHVLADGPANELVQRVGRTIFPEPPADPYLRFRARVLRNPVPNAFALPDGQIYVHTGLLALLENEAQLAAVMAHESMHVEGHHSILDARQARRKVGGMIALSVVLGNIGNLINIAFLHSIIGYGRDLEEEADRRAVERVLVAGYDPREMPRVFELLDEDPEGDRLEVKPSWSDHPQNVAREAYTRELLVAMEPRIAEQSAGQDGLKVGEERFAEAVAWAAKDSIEMYIQDDRPRTALVLARRVAARWSEDPDSHSLLGEAYRALDARTAEPDAAELSRKAKRAKYREYVRHTREERERLRREDPALAEALQQNWARAEEAYRAALERRPDHSGALRGLGLLYEEQGYLEEAGRHLADYLRTAPDAADKPIILRHLSAITAALKAGAEVEQP